MNPFKLLGSSLHKRLESKDDKYQQLSTAQLKVNGLITFKGTAP